MCVCSLFVSRGHVLLAKHNSKTVLLPINNTTWTLAWNLSIVENYQISNLGNTLFSLPTVFLQSDVSGSVDTAQPLKKIGPANHYIFLNFDLTSVTKEGKWQFSFFSITVNKLGFKKFQWGFIWLFMSCRELGLKYNPGTSLVFQWLRLCSQWGERVGSLVGEGRSHMPPSMAEKKKKGKCNPACTATKSLRIK